MENSQGDWMHYEAVNLGFDGSWITKMIAQYGPGVVAIIVAASKNGMTTGLIIQILTMFGPAALQYLISLTEKKNIVGNVGQDPVYYPNEFVAIDNIVDLVVQTELPKFLEKHMPMLIEKHGPQIMQAFVNALLKYLQELQTRPQLNG